MNIEPCPNCSSVATTLHTGAGDTRAYVECAFCGVRGPMGTYIDPRPWNVAAIDDWNLWARATRHALNLNHT